MTKKAKRTVSIEIKKTAAFNNLIKLLEAAREYVLAENEYLQHAAAKGDEKLRLKELIDAARKYELSGIEVEQALLQKNAKTQSIQALTRIIDSTRSYAVTMQNMADDLENGLRCFDKKGTGHGR